MPNRGKIVTLGANVLNVPIGNFGARDEYVCANAQITQGLTATPSSLEECFSKFPKISEIVIRVLLKVVLTLAIPTLTTFFCFFFCFDIFQALFFTNK